MMMAIVWLNESIHSVEEWDCLSFTDCEQLVRGLYRSAGVLPAATVDVEPAAHSGWRPAARARMASSTMKQPTPYG